MASYKEGVVMAKKKTAWDKERKKQMKALRAIKGKGYVPHKETKFKF